MVRTSPLATRHCLRELYSKDLLFRPPVGLRAARTAAKIACLLGRSRLRRKRGRLFLRLGWRSQDGRPRWCFQGERLATCLFGLTPSSFFECSCGEEMLDSPVLAPAEGDYEWQSTMLQLSGGVQAGTGGRSGRGEFGLKRLWGERAPSRARPSCHVGACP